MIAVVRRPPREYVDFSHIPENHWAIDLRLIDWGRWCRSKTNQQVAPGFGLHRSDAWNEREYGTETSSPVNKLDAARVASAVAQLPDKHRRAIQWHYVKPTAPGKKASELGVTMQGLADLCRDARQMLINRHV